MNPPLILLMFVFLAIIIGIAWWGKRRLSLILFVIFLIAATLLAWHHMTDALAIEF